MNPFDVAEEPSHDEPVISDCSWCGTTYVGQGDDCGGCRLDDEQCAAYLRELR